MASLRIVLDDATGKWEIRVNRVEPIDPPDTIQQAMEKQMPEARRRRSELCFSAIHNGRPDPQLLSHQYLQMLPRLALGEDDKVFLIPSEFSQAFGGLQRALERVASSADAAEPAAPRTANATRNGTEPDAA